MPHKGNRRAALVSIDWIDSDRHTPITMNTTLILKLSAAIFFGGLHSAHASLDERKAEARTGKRAKSATSVSIGGSQDGEEGKVIYNQKEVWKGKVRTQLLSIAKSIDGVDYAAAWDGEKLIWENLEGAAEKLNGDLRELLQRKQALAE